MTSPRLSREKNPARARRDALLDELRCRHPTLPRRLGELARYLLDHPTETALGTVAGLAWDAGLQPSALVRLAQAMGFSGFSELQDVLRAALAEAAPSYQERVRQRSSGTGGLLRQACALNELSLQHLAETDQAVVDRAATLLAGAGAVHVIGQRRSHAVAVHLAYGLTRAGSSPGCCPAPAASCGRRQRRCGPATCCSPSACIPTPPRSSRSAAWRRRRA